MHDSRHLFLWRLLRHPAALFLKIVFNYSGQPAPKLPTPFVLVANHTTDFDPITVGCSFKKHMYFVASEHLFRKGILTRLIRWAFAPIARVKGSADSVSAMKIMRAVRHKFNVGIFVEGDKSWNGVTGKLHPTTARLIKSLGAGMVTYKISGGYFSSPRWSSNLRRGYMSGGCVNYYSKEQLGAMSAEEVAKAIKNDIGEDAYAAQRLHPVAFRGKRLAEGLEKALYVCPSCRRVCSMHSRDNLFYCDCGLCVKYNEYGFFEGENAPFETITEWDVWQEKFLREYIGTLGDGPIYEDADQRLISIGEKHKEVLVAEGTLRLYKDRLTLGDFETPLAKLYRISVYGSDHVVFSAGGINYEVKSDTGRSGRKYETMFDILSERKAADSANT